jgi:hypothetical protein
MVARPGWPLPSDVQRARVPSRIPPWPKPQEMLAELSQIDTTARKIEMSGRAHEDPATNPSASTSVDMPAALGWVALCQHQQHRSEAHGRFVSQTVTIERRAVMAAS